MGWYDKVECPYCGYKHDMSTYEFDENDELDIECENEDCEKEFEVIREWIPTYSATTIKYYTCIECSKEYRDCNMIIQKDGHICKNCYFKKEIENLNKTKNTL